jgi:hypothetical protein
MPLPPPEELLEEAAAGGGEFEPSVWARAGVARARMPARIPDDRSNNVFDFCIKHLLCWWDSSN